MLAVLFWRSFGASWGVSMVMESGRGVSEASKWCKDLQKFCKCVLDSITEFCLVCRRRCGHHRGQQGFCHRYI
jgi:hypothetical protein